MSLRRAVELRVQQIMQDMQRSKEPTKAVILSSRRIAISSPTKGPRTAEAAATGRLCGVYRVADAAAEQIEADIWAALADHGMGPDTTMMEIRVGFAVAD